MNSNTTRTDAAKRKDIGGANMASGGYICSAEFAEGLERELNDAIAAGKKWLQALPGGRCRICSLPSEKGHEESPHEEPTQHVGRRYLRTS